MGTGATLAANDEQAEDQEDGEEGGGQETMLDVVVASTQPYQRGAKRASSISTQGKEGKEGGAATRDAGGGDADGPGPHDAYGKSADHASGQGYEGNGGQGGGEVGGKAEQAGCRHVAHQVHVLPLLAIPQPTETHAEGEAAGACQVADGLVHPQR